MTDDHVVSDDYDIKELRILLLLYNCKLTGCLQIWLYLYVEEKKVSVIKYLNTEEYKKA